MRMILKNEIYLGSKEVNYYCIFKKKKEGNVIQFLFVINYEILNVTNSNSAKKNCF